MMKKRSALSLVEVVIYVAIVSTMGVVFVMFGIQMTELRAETEQRREVIENGHYIMDVLSYQIRDAEAILSATYGSHPGDITLDTDSGSLTIDTTTKTVHSKSIRYMQIDEGSGATPMSSDQVDITNFVLTDLQRDSEPATVQVELTVTSHDGVYSESFQTSISLRE